MKALARLVALNQPDLIMFVGEALVGNDGVDQLTKFNKALVDLSPPDKIREIDAILLTKFDTVDDKGKINLKELEEAIRPSTILVAIMYANNEIGTLLPLQEVASLCKANGAFFHSDTVQTLGNYPLDLQKTPLDFMTCSAHKFHGPKGVGFLFKRENLRIQTLLHGGGQERGLRSGTENTPAILGMGVALDLAYQNLYRRMRPFHGDSNCRATAPPHSLVLLPSVSPYQNFVKPLHCCLKHHVMTFCQQVIIARHDVQVA
jgi:cysteine sulfinate desulfinase/cysteine desulfurase-like protein